MNSRNTMKERQKEMKDEKLKEMDEGIADGSLVVRQMNPEELAALQAKYPPRTPDQVKAAKRRNHG